MENKTEPLYETKTDFTLKLYMKACKTSARKAEKADFYTAKYIK